MKPIISTVILNWNRSHLLRRTVESYLATITVPYELVIIDNNSQDDSPDYIESITADVGKHRAIFLAENIGGEAINLGYQSLSGKFFHHSSNDIEYLHGWDIEALRKFDAFPELGQLGLFSPFPQTELGEVWELHEATPITRNGETVYATNANVGGSCLIRRELWDSGVRWTNVPGTNLPNDGLLSGHIRREGFLIAWNDKYLGRNWGHNIAEFMIDPAYYHHDYELKSWLGVEGFRKRLLAHGYDLTETDDGPKITRN